MTLTPRIFRRASAATIIGPNMTPRPTERAVQDILGFPAEHLIN